MAKQSMAEQAARASRAYHTGKITAEEFSGLLDAATHGYDHGAIEGYDNADDHPISWKRRDDPPSNPLPEHGSHRGRR
jgi:hypothetical protein